MASKYRKKFSLPENFYPILEDYSREVLRDQPIDIVEFSYLYFKAMEEVRRFVTNFFQGTLDTFNYPRKGKNIPPPKEGRPLMEEEQQMMQEQEGYDQEEYGDQEGYD